MAYRRPGQFPAGQSAVIGKNVRALRQGRGWTVEKLAELMCWPSPSTVCGAEGSRPGRQRRFTVDEVGRLADIFGVSPEQLNTRCVNCGGQPPVGFACLACGTASPRPGPDRSNNRRAGKDPAS